MVWSEQWSIKIDGNELNSVRTGGNFLAEIPQLENMPDYDPVIVPMDGAYPAFIRLQPRESAWALNIAMKPCDWATWQTQLQSLKAVLTAGVHTLTVQVRGMPSPVSTTVVVRGMMVEPKARVLSVQLLVPKPVLA